MLLFVASFLAGVLTILAPCILPLLPIVIGSGVEAKSRKPVWLLIGSLTGSVVLFTLLLRASTLLIQVPQQTWTIVSGVILVFFGLITIFPDLWTKVASKLTSKSEHSLQSASQQQGWKKPVLMGLALGPVFTSCSPTYALIIAVVLPASFLAGVFYTVVYALGLASVLLLIALLGHKLTKKLRGAADPKGWFKRVLGILFLLVGVSIIFGWDKSIEAWIIEQGYFGVTTFEETLVEQLR